MHDVASIENNQETMALLKILALGLQQIREGRVHSVSDVLSKIRGRSKISGGQ